MSVAEGNARGLWRTSAHTVNNNNNNHKTIQPDWLKTTLTEVADVVKHIWKTAPKRFVSSEIIFEALFSGMILRLAGGQQWLKGRWLMADWQKRSVRVFCCLSRGWCKKESSQVFTFKMIGASCATLHSIQETLWHFKSRGNEWKSTPVKLFLLLFIFLMTWILYSQLLS